MFNKLKSLNLKVKKIQFLTQVRSGGRQELPLYNYIAGVFKKAIPQKNMKKGND